jgi:hypothetical protein
MAVITSGKVPLKGDTRYRASNLHWSPIDFGIVPVIELSAMLTLINDECSHRLAGIVPVKPFPSSSRVRKEVRFQMSESREPVTWQDLRCL